MKIIEKTTEFELTEDTAVAIGKFDGFHMGHQKLLHMVTEQKAKGLAAAVFTFVPSPAAFFSKSSGRSKDSSNREVSTTGAFFFESFFQLPMIRPLYRITG